MCSGRTEGVLAILRRLGVESVPVKPILSGAVAALVLALACAPAGAAEPPPFLAADAGRVLEEVRRPGAAVVLVNVWATWCVPCREEFPDLLRLRRDHEQRGLRLVLVSADLSDQREDARAFLAAHGVDFPTFHKDAPDAAFIEALSPAWSGALPATMLFDARGTLRNTWESKRTYAELAAIIEPFLRDVPPTPTSDRREKDR